MLSAAELSIMSTKKIYPVSALIKANEILEFLLNVGEASFTEIHSSLGHPKSSTYKTLSTLESIGYIREIGESGKYTLGLRLIEFGARAAAQIDLTTEARPIVKELSNDTQRNVHLGILDGTEVIYLLKENVHGSISIDTWAGKRVAVHSTAIGKVLLAWKREQEIDQILDQVEFVKLTPNTRMSAEEVRGGLNEVRIRGWATDDEENWKMVRCVAAPIRDARSNVCAALSVSTLTDLDSQEQMETIREKILKAARLLSQRLGAPE